MRVDDVICVWDATNRQDWRLCELTQRGVLSSRYTPGPHSPDREGGIQHLLDVYRLFLDGNPL